MHRIMFVCHGNICRSPMAEMIAKEIVRKRGLQELFLFDSCATSTEEIIRGVGNPIHPRARQVLEHHGIPCLPHRAKQLRWEDYEQYDYFLGMDEANKENMRHMLYTDPKGKIHKITKPLGIYQDVDDPWYTGRFEEVYEQLYAACNAWIDDLAKK